MPVQGNDPFQAMKRKADEWLAELCQEMRTENRHLALAALRSTLHVLRDVLQTDESAQFAAQLPTVIRGVYFEGWDPAPRPGRLHADAFLESVAEGLGERAPEAERCARAVFSVLAGRVSKGEVADVRGMLPADVAALWPPQPVASIRG